MAEVLGNVLLDGELLAAHEARVPVLDRGFLFGDAVYEVIALYHDTPFLLDRHLDRLERSLAAVACPNPHTRSQWRALIARLLDANASQTRAAIYLQITRGDSQQREHVFPGVCRPRVLAMLMSNVPPSERLLSEGLHLVSVEDIRWRACYIKANSLLANVLAREHARTLDADEALLHRDGCALEGATSNILAWIDNTLVSPPDGPDILPGVTRDWVLEQAAQAGIACERREIPLDALRRADEVWITSTNREVLAVTRLDDQPIGGGVPGDHWRGAWARYRASVT